MRTRQITASDGVRLAVQEHGDRTNPTIVAVHGYPDDHVVWDGAVAALAERYHVVTYDVRGAGHSEAPTQRSAYGLDQLECDLAVVVEEVSPYAPVHLLAHDWGSIQAWHAVTGDRMRGRIASFTSVSGPCLDHAGHWFRSRLRRPSPKRLRELVTQLACSGYIGFFQLPLLPELAWRSRLLPRLLGTLERLDPAAAAQPARPSLSDGLRGLALYRANMLARLGGPRERRADIPVQVLAPTGDPFVSPALQTDIARWVPDLRIRRVPGGHWLPRTRPDVVTRCTSELVEDVEHGRQARPLRRARVGGKRPRCADQLVVITGAGSGIGRETALAFAEQGAEIVAADRDQTAAARTAELAGLLGPQATPYAVDVSDGAAMEDFAKHVQTELGVPDVVVNNAGIGVAGPFAETSVEDWQRVIDVNLWGVIHGCRAFAAQMTDRGEGGQIVNVASAAAYLPSRTLSAYATTKSAVLTLSQCLRAELASSGIGVSTVCPGFVHTNITARTRFVGLNDDGQQQRQQAATRMYRRRNFTPDRAAREILRTVETNAALTPITPEATAGLVLSRLTPGLLRAAARADLTPG
ncbi:short-subunit dehydrogenase [Halopolyspora algeriensis]|uniref:Short-subunit dehydrogenase n=1 Tax=Halopolyspora algeriensis TaxID=1500506 RepID=A0A368VVX4_9ACTN|nr:SDR family oxidoreductase [Halopolyspora algeriensis]RCW46025.1 short-subunit dehydrogenase [Halopolyspora algeriensis]TQM55437.1 short-subunit dehydrogenase [Halopolyspora algeriensis]